MTETPTSSRKYAVVGSGYISEVLVDYATWVRSSNSALMFMVLTEAMSSTGTVHDQYQEFLSARRRGIQRWLRAQRPEGVDPDEAAARERAFAVTLNGSVLGIHLQCLVEPDGIDLDAALQALASMTDNVLPDLWAGVSAAAGSNGTRKRARKRS